MVAVGGLAALPASEWTQGPLGCTLGMSVLVKVLSRQIDAPPACFIYYNKDHSVGREGSLLPIQEFHKRGALMFLVVGKPQNVGWVEGTVQVILQKSYLSPLVAQKSHFSFRFAHVAFRHAVTMGNNSCLSIKTLSHLSAGEQSEPGGDPRYCFFLRKTPNTGNGDGQSCVQPQ